MHSDDAVDRLRELLVQAEVDLERPTIEDVERTWNVWRRFADEPVEDAAPRDEDGDGILAQYGTYGWSKGRFEVDLTRQFTFADEDGEYDHMAQLSCTFRFEMTDTLRALPGGDLWSFGMDLDAFFAAALALPGFAAVRESRAEPVELDIGYGDV
jgi:hypothetical protein